MSKVQINSEQELEREVLSLADFLQDVKTDWNLRINALKRVKAIIENESQRFDCFPQIFMRFIPSLSAQLNDLRSAVVKEAAAVVFTAVQMMGNSFEYCAERLQDNLFKLLNSGTKILSDTGHECSLEIYSHIISWRLIPKTLEQFKHKNANMRVKSAQYLEYMLEHIPRADFEQAQSHKNSFLDHIENGIVQAISDAAAEARAAGRRCYIHYQNLFPDRSDRIFRKLDSSAQKTLSDLSPNKLLTRDSPSRPKELPKRSNSVKKLKNEPERPSSVPHNLTKNGPTKSLVLPPKKNGQRSTMSSRSTLPHAHTVSELTGDLIPPPHSIDENPRTPPFQEKKPQLDMLDQLAASAFDTIQKSAKKDPENIKDPITKFEFLIEKTYNENWSTRFNAFERLETKFNTENSAGGLIDILNSNEACWNKLIETIIEHISDTHYKVAIASLNFLRVVLEVFPEKVSFSLEALMPKLLSCLSENNENITSHASNVFELIMDIYIPEDLLILFLKLTPHPKKIKLRTKLLELYSQLITASGAYLNSTNNTRTLVRKISSVLKDTPTTRELTAAGLNVLHVVRDKNPTQLVSSLLELPENELQVIKKIVSESNSPIDKDLKPASRKVAIIEEDKQEIPQSPQIGTFITSLVRQCKTPGAVRYDALKKIQDLNGTSLTDANFISVTNALINCLDDPTPSIRDLAIQTINTLIVRNPTKLNPILTETLNDLVKGFYSDDRSLHQATEDLIEEILSCHNNPEVITVLTKIISLTQIPATQALIRQLTKAMKRMPADSIVGYLRTVMDKMKEVRFIQSFNHNNADVRKSVVFCLVEIFILLGRRFQPYLDELSPSQQKLVNIYIQRRQESYV